MTVGSVCSGIEAATVALKPIGYEFKWYSEIAKFPSELLREKYPETPNVGNMVEIEGKLERKEIEAVDMICGGTPCQAYSLAGGRKGLEDERGLLALEFIKIVDKNDEIRGKRGLVFWENVEGVLTDKTNAFGCFLRDLAGLEEAPKCDKWAKNGYIEGTKRKVAWRVLDSKYFGVPQQRKRLYVLASGKEYNPQNVLFEEKRIEGYSQSEYIGRGHIFNKNGVEFEVFRDYTDCLYSAYGTKWNGNAAAINGSLFVVENRKIRRLQPLECERLMGFEDNYTKIQGASNTERYRAMGNSWCIPVIRWIGNRIEKGKEEGKEIEKLEKGIKPLNVTIGKIEDIIEKCEDSRLYLSDVGIRGILRRNAGKLNSRLEEIMRSSVERKEK